MSKSQIGYRRIREATPGETPGGDMYETDLPGLGEQLSIARTGSPVMRKDRLPSRQVATGFTLQGSATTQFDYDSGDKNALREEAFAAVAAGAAGPVSAAGITAVDVGNKLVNPAGWAGLAAGDDVLVVGLGGSNPPLFLAGVVAVAGNDLSLSVDDVDLEDNVPAGNVSVYYSKRFRLGQTLLTSTLESWNASSVQRGSVWRSVACTQWGISSTYPNPLTEAFSLEAFKLPQDITNPLGNGTIARVDQPQIDGNNNLQDALNPGAGLGFRYTGPAVGVAIPLDEVYLKQVQLQIQNPMSARGGLGRGFGNQDALVDGKFQIRVTLQMERGALADDSQVDALVADSKNPAAEIGLRFGYADNLGQRGYFRCPVLEPQGRAIDGVGENGAQLVTINYTGAPEATTLHTPFQWSHFDTPA